MLQNQCRAFCQCEFCKNPKEKEKGDDCCIHICNLHDSDNGPSKDELYARCLQKSIQNRALIASMKNAHRFITDEMLASSRAKRDAKDREYASKLIPVRRRDRLQELLLLEHAARIREGKRVRAERRAQGLPEDSDDDSCCCDCNEENEGKESSSTPSEQPEVLSRGSTPASKCSAEHDLQSTLEAIENIVKESPDARPVDPLNRNQIFQLRKLVHERAKKDRKQVEECPNQPHLCPHCFAVNVQGKHLCPQMSGSVAFRTTGKVINPNNRVKFGLTEHDALPNGQYDDTVNRAGVGKGFRLAEYNPHPYGTGVIFPPLVAADTKASHLKPRHEFYTGPLRKGGKELFNNNICDCEPAKNALQYPGSTYNVYDGREGAYGRSVGGSPPGDACCCCMEGNAPCAAEGERRILPHVAEGSPKGQEDPMKRFTSTSALWRTTNMEREADLERYLDFQKNRLKAVSKDVYECGIAGSGVGR